MFIKYESFLKTITFAIIHFMVGFTIAYLFTGSIAIAGGIALVEPLANTVVYYIHEKAWTSYGIKKHSPTSWILL